MTLRHLLTHTAGMPPDGCLEEGSRDEDTIDKKVQTILPTFKNLPIAGQCGYQYSSWGYNVIGTVASTVTGKSLSALIDEYVLRPLGTERTTFDYFIASTYPLSMPHKRDKKGNLCALHYQRFNTVYHAGAGLFSNTTDLCRLLRFFMNDGCTDSGERILSQDSLNQMRFPYNQRSNCPEDYYGLGRFIKPYADGFMYGHTGNY
jgi:CubicO group peptidase (beta-lactamase class C family)